MPPSNKNKPADPNTPAAKSASKPLSYPALYDKFLSVAMAVPAEQADTFRGDARIVFTNLRLGINAALGNDAMIAFAKEHLPKLPIDDALELPNLGRALVFAARRVTTRTLSPQDIATKLNGITGPREDMLSIFETLARRNVVSKETAARIRAGSGKFDLAQDVVDLVHEYRKAWDDLAGKHPFNLEEMTQWSEDAEWLVENLNPEGARTAPKTKSPASDVRDRFAAVIQGRHIVLRKVGFYLFGETVDEHVPRLLSRVSSTTTGEEDLEGGEGEGSEAGGG